MPIIVRLQHCVIAMYFQDHNPPHFHVLTSESEAMLRISSLEVMEGEVVRRALREARNWAAVNRSTLEDAWRKYSG